MTRWNLAYLKAHKKEHKLILHGEYVKVTRDTIIKGDCKTLGCKNLFEKSFRLVVNCGAFCVPCMKKIQVQKSIATNLKLRGVSFASQDPAVQKKRQETNIKYPIVRKPVVKKVVVKKPIVKKPLQIKESPYSYSRLLQLSIDLNITLLGKYETVYSTTPIKGKCCTKNCEDEFNKKFKALLNTGPFCLACSKQKFYQKVREINLKKYGVANQFQRKEVKEQMKKTNLEKYGHENAAQSKVVKDKMKKTNLKKYGHTNASKSKVVKDKMKKTNLERYGHENAAQSKVVQDKMKATNLVRFGYENVLKNEDIKQKVKDTNMKKRGVPCSFQDETVKEKSQQTNLKRHGVRFPMQSKKILSKSSATSMKHYGTRHPMQNSVIAKKCFDNAHAFYDYKFPSGRISKQQGYEYMALDFLIRKVKDDKDIITGMGNVPELWWIDSEGKKRRHYVDIFWKSRHRCIEVKSTWTFENDKERVFLKQKFAKEAGFEYEIWVFDSKGACVDVFE